MPKDHLDRFDLDAAPLTVAGATLIVQDLDRLVRFYRDALGLTVIKQTDDAVTLGAGTPFLTLVGNRDARRANPREPGLFHIAFLLPDRQSLSSWLSHVLATGVTPIGASDHNVSEAIYLEDPEGNGIEVYVDRPVAGWAGPDGRVFMPSRRLDLAALPDPTDWLGAPDQTRIGHVHLKSPDLVRSEQFWIEQGFDVTARYPGGSFFGAGGYHHQLAANVWHGTGHAVPEGPVTGLSELALTTSGTPRHPAIAPSGVRVTYNPKGV